ncbi:MAG: hypothetical protein JO317_03140 [Verrucomicrobiae bacterium]|nr:hypothetical protein [Verrucomicrobiae bacterium]
MTDSTRSLSGASRFPLHASRAFTLLELAIVVCLVAMMMTVAAVQLRGYRKHQELEFAARTLRLKLKGLGQRAVRRQLTVEVLVDTERQRMSWHATLPPDPDSSNASDEIAWTDPEVLSEWPKTLLLASWKPGAAEGLRSIFFYPDGRSSGGKLIFTRRDDPNESMELDIVDWSGQVRMEPGP